MLFLQGSRGLPEVQLQHLWSAEKEVEQFVARTYLQQYPILWGYLYDFHTGIQLSPTLTSEAFASEGLRLSEMSLSRDKTGQSPRK